MVLVFWSRLNSCVPAQNSQIRAPRAVSDEEGVCKPASSWGPFRQLCVLLKALVSRVCCRDSHRLAVLHGWWYIGSQDTVLLKKRRFSFQGNRVSTLSNNRMVGAPLHATSLAPSTFLVRVFTKKWLHFISCPKIATHENYARGTFQKQRCHNANAHAASEKGWHEFLFYTVSEKSVHYVFHPSVRVRVRWCTETWRCVHVYGGRQK